MRFRYRSFSFRARVQGVALTGMCIGMLAIGISLGAGWIFSLLALCIATALISDYSAWRALQGVTARQGGTLSAIAGECCRSSVVLEAGKRGRRLLAVVDGSLGAPAEKCVPYLPAGPALTVQVTKTPPLRGIFPAGELEVRSAGPFGLFEYGRYFQAESEGIVRPATFILEAGPAGGLSLSGAAPAASNRTGNGTGVLGVRPHRPGDELKAIDWRSSARRGELMIKEFERESARPAAIVLDVASASLRDGEPGSPLEQLVSFAASAALALLNEGAPLVLMSNATGVEPMLKPRNCDEALVWFATLRKAPPDAPIPAAAGEGRLAFTTADRLPEWRRSGFRPELGFALVLDDTEGLAAEGFRLCRQDEDMVACWHLS